MNNKHTPGPWYVGAARSAAASVDADNGALPRVWGPDKSGIADLCTRRQLGEGTSAEELANARLIAAAPDLLETLRFIVNDAEPGEDAVLSVEGYNKACAAIAKAAD